MAINLNAGEAHDRLRAQELEDRKLKFKIAKIGIAGLAGLIAVSAVATGIATSASITSMQGQYELLQQEYEAVKAEAAQNEIEIKAAEEEAAKNPDKVDRYMYSAYEAGTRVAELLNTAYKEGGLKLAQDKADWKKYLPGLSTEWKDTVWYGETLDPGINAIEWRFLTWYDSTEKDYGAGEYNDNTVWGCYATGKRGTYLLCVRYASYDGEQDCFRFKSNVSHGYVSSYGAMYISTGKIEDDGPSRESLEIDDMADQLLSLDGSEESDEYTDNTEEYIDREEEHIANAGAAGQHIEETASSLQNYNAADMRSEAYTPAPAPAAITGYETMPPVTETPPETTAVVTTSVKEIEEPGEPAETSPWTTDSRRKGKKDEDDDVTIIYGTFGGNDNEIVEIIG